jgi:Fe-S cluster assembly protein SufD
MDASVLPNRRVEAWKYSDLRATLGGEPLVLRDGRDIIERLAPGTQRMTIPAGEERLFVERMDSAYLDARAFDFDIGPGATLTRIIIQDSAGPALAMARVRVAEGARYQQFALTEGSRLARIETHVDVEGENAKVEINGAYLCAADKHADLTSVITHKAPGAETRQLIKGVARKGGRGVFQGKIVVERAAQKTDARQHHQALMLEDGAEIFAKPELMIFADDVQCAHGNTTGALDEGALFYMRSRGIAEKDARALLTEAFLVEAIPDGLPEALHEELLCRIRAWLERGA